MAAALSCKFYPTNYTASFQRLKRLPYICCTVQTSPTNIKVIINGAAKEIGRAAVLAVTKARGMEVAAAVDSYLVGEDIGKVCDMEEPLEIPIINDITMVLGSISQSKDTAVVVDFTDVSTVYDNVKQATAFGMKSVVYVPRMKMETVAALSAFCEKASMGCLVAPTLSIGSILLQQAAISASFHYNNVEIVESKSNVQYIDYSLIFNAYNIKFFQNMQEAVAGPVLFCRHWNDCLVTREDLPSQDVMQIANNITNLGQMYNREDISSDILARGQLLGEDGVRVHSLVLPSLPSSTTVYFSRPGEVYTLKHDITNVQSLMPGLLLAIRKVVRLKNLVYGLEKFL
ncbi:Dihydrodipicolinate reductase [Perilla frutescens var. hirtella]|nr:Dihydrodipicolinate reductase [Perilla frutescens var. hirtella]